MLYINNMSINIYDINKTVIVTILLVLCVRLLLKKSPKKYSYFLWIVVLFRMIFPYSIKSFLSIYNIEKIITPVVQNNTVNQVITIIQPQYIKNAVNAADILGYYEIPGTNILNFDTIEFIIIWLIVVFILLVYAIVTYLDLKTSLKKAIRIKDNIYQSDKVFSPFVIGIIKPKIILPFHLDEQAQELIIKHEQLHIKRKDYILRIFFYFLVIIYWINPFVWLAYYLFIKDMEMSCDEYVCANYKDINKTYSYTLLHVASHQQISLPKPLAFGENSIKERVKNILHFKQPNKKTILLSLCLCVYCLLAFTTDPTNQKKINHLLNDYNINSIKQVEIINYYTNYEPRTIETSLIESWYHLSKIELLFNYIEISDQTIQPSNKMIDSEFKILGENNQKIILKFVEDYTECIVESSENSKSYKIKNDKLAIERLYRAQDYNRVYLYPKNQFDLNQGKYGNNNQIGLLEKQEYLDVKFEERYAYLQIKQLYDEYYYSIDCTYSFDENKLTMVSEEDANIIVFNIIENKGEYEFILNENESNIIYEDLLESLKLFVFTDKNPWY